jgi:hypothetical protein
MKVKVLRQFLDGSRLVHEGDVIDVPERRARALAAKKPPLVVLTIGSGMRPKAGEAAVVGAIDPTPSLQIGGPTGEDKPVLLRRRGRPRKVRPYISPEDERGS